MADASRVPRRIALLVLGLTLSAVAACAIDVNPIGHCPPDGGGGSCAEDRVPPGAAEDAGEAGP
jgi:hypothetical protein